jgi:hypothetical protein
LTSAPNRVAAASFPVPAAAPITVVPAVLASWVSSDPIRPAPAVINTVSRRADAHRGQDTRRDRAGLEDRDGTVEWQADRYEVRVGGLGEGQLRVAAGAVDGGGYDVLLPQWGPVGIGPGFHHRASDLEARHVWLLLPSARHSAR